MKGRVVLIALGLLVLTAACAMAWMIGPRNVLGMLLYDQRREGLLQVGGQAPDVTLTALDGSELHLASLVGPKPLVLVFGSFT